MHRIYEINLNRARRVIIYRAARRACYNNDIMHVINIYIYIRMYYLQRVFCRFNHCWATDPYCSSRVLYTINRAGELIIFAPSKRVVSGARLRGGSPAGYLKLYRGGGATGFTSELYRRQGTVNYHRPGTVKDI